MERRAILIGNLNATGAQKDINKWKKFLLSGRGGAWNVNEISILTNPTKLNLETFLNAIKKMSYDFVLVVYAGHGCWERSTILEINSSGETINESMLKDLALRQIISLDCCRGTSESDQILNETQLQMFSDSTRSSIRKQYDSRMMQATPQQVTLYACRVGESAYCTDEGGYYTKNLLGNCASTTTGIFKTINEAHALATKTTTKEVRETENRRQNPEISCVRCPVSQQLIIGIDTSSYGY